LSEDTGFTFDELFHMRMDYLMMLKDVKDQIIEERNKAQEEAEAKQSGAGTKLSSNSFSASSIKSLASKYGVSMPSGLHL